MVEDVTADVLRRHKLYLFENIKKRRHGTKHNTVATRFRYLNALFNSSASALTQRLDKTIVEKGNVVEFTAWCAARIAELYGPVLHHRFADKNTVFTWRKDNALNSRGDKITIADKHPNVRLIAICYFDPFVGR